MANFKEIFQDTLVFEGGFQDNPKDTGNYCNGKLIGTYRGISAVGYRDYFKKCPTPNDLKSLSENQVYTIAKLNYWDKIKGDKIKNQAVAHFIFDSVWGGYGFLDVRKAINSTYGKKLLQENNNWGLSDYELNLINNANQKKLFTEIYNFRTKRLSNNPEFSKGWLRKLDTIYNKYVKEIYSYGKDNLLGISLIFVGILGVSYLLYKKYKK